MPYYIFDKPKPADAWNFDDSIFKGFKDEELNKCFEFDFENAFLNKFIKVEDDLQKVKELVK